MNWFRKIKAKRLIRAALNGSINEQQQAELNRLLSKDLSLKMHYDQMKAMDQQLQNLKEPEKPVDVSNGVMTKIRALANDKAFDRLPKSGSLAVWYTYPVRYAAAAVAGILIGVGSMLVITQSEEVTESGLQGTMMQEERHDGFAYRENNLQIRLIPYLQDDVIYLHFFLDSDEAIHFQVDFDKEALQPVTTGLRNDSGVREISFSSQELSFSAKGQISAQLGFKKKADNPKPLLVKALKNGRLIVTKKISP
ncbi:MAG: hypothetical protein ACQESX_06060 [Bacteroidota bacterium]